jgi:hypothetical protein
MPWCPQCGTEYREGLGRCSDCGATLVAAPPAERAEEHGPEWVAAAGFTGEDEARIAQGLLAEKGIAAEVVSRQVVLYPFPQADAAEVLLLVAPADLERADRELERAEAGEDAVTDEDVAAADEPPQD